MRNIQVHEDGRANAAAMPATFAGRYLLEHAASTGAVSVLWRARDLETGDPVALKFFPPLFVETPADRRAAEELVAETRLVRLPGVVAASGLVISEKYAAFVAPWIEGPTFRQMVYAQPARFFEVAALRRWLGGLLATIEAAHQKSLVHGDLDPDVVRQSAGAVYVVGWGVNAWLRRAAARHRLRAPPDDLPWYLSPAQLRGEVPHPPDDVFALGAIAYEMLAGVPPRSGGWWWSRQLSIAKARQRRFHDGGRGEGIPAAWERAIMRCLEPRERDRLGSVRELRLRLDLPETETRPAAAVVGPTPRAQTTDTVPPRPRTEPVPAPAVPPDPLVAAVPGTFWLRAMITLAVLLTLGIGGLGGWKLYERHQVHHELLAAVQRLPVSASADVQANLEARLHAARSKVSSEQWASLRAAWEQRLPASPPPVTSESGESDAPRENEGADRPVETSFGPGRQKTEEDPPAPLSDVASPDVRENDASASVVAAEAITPGPVPEPPLTGTVHFETEPAGVAFTVRPLTGDRPLLKGRAPADLNLPAGRYIVVFRTEGNRSRSRIVDVAPGERVIADAVLTVSNERVRETEEPVPPPEVPDAPAAEPRETPLVVAETKVVTPPVPPDPKVASEDSARAGPVPEAAAPVAAASPALVRDRGIFEIGEVDVAPRLLERVDPVLPSRGGGRSSATRLDLIVIIDRHGRVASAELRSEVDGTLVEPVLRAVRQWRFQPAERAGNAVPVRVSVPLTLPAS